MKTQDMRKQIEITCSKYEQQAVTAQKCGFNSWIDLAFNLVPLYSDYGIMTVEYARNASNPNDDDIFSFRGLHSFKDMERAALDEIYFGIAIN